MYFFVGEPIMYIGCIIKKLANCPKVLSHDMAEVVLLHLA